MKTSLALLVSVVSLALGCGRDAMLGEEVAPESVAEATPDPWSKAESPKLSDCDVAKVYAEGTCGTYFDGKNLRPCSSTCRRIDDDSAVANCMSMGRHHYIHEAQNATTNPSTWNDPSDAVIGPLACIESAAQCSAICQQQH